MSELVREIIDRLARDAETFAAEERNSISDARIRCAGLKRHSAAMAKLVSMALDLYEQGHHTRAVALLRGDMTEDARPAQPPLLQCKRCGYSCRVSGVPAGAPCTCGTGVLVPEDATRAP